MKVYRFEHQRGPNQFWRGAICDGIAHRFNYEQDSQDDPYNHPSVIDKVECDTPMGKFWLANPSTLDFYRFGCKSIEQLKQCFRTAHLWSEFRRFNCRLAVYEVDEQFVHLGNYQLIFLRGRATLIEAYVPDFDNPEGTPC